MKKLLLITITLVILGLEIKAQKLLDRGLAEVITDYRNTDKALALHRNIPRGTMVLLRNPANGRETEARIIGRLPATGNYHKVIMKISEAAAIDLNITGKRFAIEVYPYIEEKKEEPVRDPSTITIKKKTHVVKKGDTMYSLAKQYKTTIKQLQKWNNMTDYNIKPGQILKVSN